MFFVVVVVLLLLKNTSHQISAVIIDIFSIFTFKRIIFFENLCVIANVFLLIN